MSERVSRLQLTEAMLEKIARVDGFCLATGERDAGFCAKATYEEEPSVGTTDFAADMFG